MEIISQNKIQRKASESLKIKVAKTKKFDNLGQPQNMVPGKSLEQIRLEALQQLREMGLFF